MTYKCDICGKDTENYYSISNKTFYIPLCEYCVTTMDVDIEEIHSKNNNILIPCSYCGSTELVYLKKSKYPICEHCTTSILCDALKECESKFIPK